jgi:hypothetical protein
MTPVTLPDAPVQVWNAWHQWKGAVEKAKTTDIEPVIEALESGMSYSGPSGTVSVDGPSHRNVQDVRLARVNDKHGFDVLETIDIVKQHGRKTVDHAVDFVNNLRRTAAIRLMYTDDILFLRKIQV